MQTSVNVPRPVGDQPRVAAMPDGDDSFVFVLEAAGGKARRVTTQKHGVESDPVVSHDGKWIAFGYAASPEARSEVWVASVDGRKVFRVSGEDEDALMPAFGKEDRSLLYVRSAFTGHYSPIARARKHKFDVFEIKLGQDGRAAEAAPERLTQQEFFDLRSLSVSEDGASFLVSTSGYPIGSLIEEFDCDAPLRIKRIFQPHVEGAPEGTPYGVARYAGMRIIFTAASEPQPVGNFDYNVYTMSGITGGEVTALTKHRGMIDGMVVQDGVGWFLDQGRWSRVSLPADQ